MQGREKITLFSLFSFLQLKNSELCFSLFMKKQQWMCCKKGVLQSIQEKKTKQPYAGSDQTSFWSSILAQSSQLSTFTERAQETGRQVQSALSHSAVNAALAYLGQEQFTHSEAVSKGEAPFPVKVVTLGNTTGKSSKGTGTVPHVWQ